MSEVKASFGLSAEARRHLVNRLTGRRAPAGDAAGKPIARAAAAMDLPGLREIETIRKTARSLGIADPFFRVHDGVAAAETSIDGRPYLNFASYNYLGLNGHPRIADAVGEAVRRYGTSVSASRMVSGERPLHRALETAIADFYGVEDCLCFVSGHATNVTVLGSVLQPGDLMVHDELVHNSLMQGAQLSGARRYAFRHNDADAARQLLAQHRAGQKRAILVVEGHYSMDGDIPDLPRFVELAREFDCWLMVDEAHGLGVLGRSGAGIAEHFGIDPGTVDIWMGTLSKSLVSCGGYIAGRRVLIDYLRCSAPGFVYSVGMTPPNAAAALAALTLLREEPERVARLNRNAARFLAGAKAAGLDTGGSIGAAIVPIITGSSIRAGRLADALFQRGMNVQPILYPAVQERAARLRFFLSAAHDAAQIDRAVALLAEATKLG
jgi:8-amino-7-oxononanoate synthase